MPAKSEKQRKAAGAALAVKRGDMPASKLRGAAREMAKGMSGPQLAEYATRPKRRARKKK